MSVTTEMYDPRGSTDKAQYLYDSGLLFMVNGLLHHHGLAICVDVDDETEKVVGGLGIFEELRPRRDLV